MNRVKLNYAGFRKVRQSAGVMNALTAQARAMCDRANSMHVTEGAEYEYAAAQPTDRGSIALCSTGHGNRAHVKAMADNARNNTLLKAVR